MAVKADQANATAEDLIIVMGMVGCREEDDVYVKRRVVFWRLIILELYIGKWYFSECIFSEWYFPECIFSEWDFLEH